MRIRGKLACGLMPVSYDDYFEDIYKICGDHPAARTLSDMMEWSEYVEKSNGTWKYMCKETLEDFELYLKLNWN